MLPAARAFAQSASIYYFTFFSQIMVFHFPHYGLMDRRACLAAILESQVGSRGFDAIANDARSTETQLESVKTQVQNLETEIASLSNELRPRGRVQFMDTLPDLVPDGVELETLQIGQFNQSDFNRECALK